MTSYFITGTDTNVGKTLTSAAITLALQGRYWKPVQSGIADDISDRDRVQALTDLPDHHFVTSNYIFKASLSPDQAAKKENSCIDLATIQRPSLTPSLIVEGAGGVFVPLNQTHSMLDLMQQLALPVIIVSRGTLGTINHTLLTIETLQQRGLTIQGVVFSGELNPANQVAIETWGRVNTLFHVPYFQNMTKSIFQSWVAQQQEKIVGALS